jgi:glyoxylase-like metal-dependent hydrolase (beta-lactamase superfamily II)
MKGPYKIWEDVYLIGDSNISHSMDCCVYLVDAGELVMIDAGAGRSTDRFVDNIQILELMPEKLSTIIVTHAHIDHIGSLAEFKKRYNVKIIVHSLDSGNIETGDNVGTEYYGIKYKPCPVDIKIHGENNSLNIGCHEFHMVHIPGHTPGSMAVFIDEGGKRVLFGQDIHGPYAPMWGSDPVKAVNSLEKLISLKADILCEGHYGIIRPAHAVENFIQGFLNDLTAR